MTSKQRTTTMPTIKAIETRYAGYRFRSRLEARWAVAFNSTGFLSRWEYEPQGFTVDGVPYLPDFRIWWTRHDYSWVEVKPPGYEPTAKEQKLYRGLAREAGALGALCLLRGIEPGYRVYRAKGSPTDSPEWFLEPEAIAAGRSARFEHGEQG